MPANPLRRTKCERPDPARAQATIQLMKRHILTAALLIAVSCSNLAFAQPKPLQGQKYPDVVAVKVHPANAGLFDFDVTVSSPYDNAQRYADGFRVQSKEGVVLGERKLLHDHASEQPFTRDLHGVRIPAAVKIVVIQARDQQFGYGGKVVEVALPGR